MWLSKVNLPTSYINTSESNPNLNGISKIASEYCFDMSEMLKLQKNSMHLEMHKCIKTKFYLSSSSISVMFPFKA